MIAHQADWDFIATRLSNRSMDRIKIFIYGSAVVLCGWLTASYTHQPQMLRETQANMTAGLEPPQSTANLNSQVTPDTDASAKALDTMATLEKR